MELIKERFLLHAPAAVSLGAMTLRPAPAEAELESAIRRAVSRFEGLCGRVRQRDDGTAEFLPDDPVIDIGAAELVSEYDWFEAAEDLHASPMDPFTGELVRFRVLIGPEEAVVVCALHALAGDLRSLAQLLGSVTAALDHPAFALRQVPRQTVEETHPGGRLSGMPAMMVNMCNKRWAQQGRPFGEEDYAKLCEKETALPAPVICLREFSPELTAGIKRACKDAGITPQDAAAAALALAWRSPCEIELTLPIAEGFGDLSTGAAIACDPRGTDLLPLAKKAAANRTAADGDPKKKYFLMRFLAAADPGLLDAVWYQTYGLIRHPMVAQMADLLSYGGHARQFALADGGVLSAGEGGTRVEHLRLLAPHLPDALCSAALAECGGVLTVTMQFADDEAADENAARFEDAMDMLEEMTV